MKTRFNYLHVLVILGTLLLAACGATAPTTDQNEPLPAFAPTEIVLPVSTTTATPVTTAVACTVNVNGQNFVLNPGVNGQPGQSLKSDNGTVLYTNINGVCVNMAPLPAATDVVLSMSTSTIVPVATNTYVPTADANDLCGARSGLITFVPVKDNVHGQWDRDVTLVYDLNVIWRAWSALGPEAPHDPHIVVWGDPMYYDGSLDFVHDKPGHWILTNNGVETAEFYVVVLRDPDGTNADYEMALKNDKTDKNQPQMSVYFKGSGAVMNDDCDMVDLGFDWYQTPFPKEFDGGWIFRMTLDPSEYVEFWHGAQEFSCPSGCSDLHSPFDLPVWTGN